VPKLVGFGGLFTRCWGAIQRFDDVAIMRCGDGRATILDGQVVGNLPYVAGAFLERQGIPAQITLIALESRRRRTYALGAANPPDSEPPTILFTRRHVIALRYGGPWTEEHGQRLVAAQWAPLPR
jgi:hypothetical protein